ncbi:MAG: glycosyltransferase family 39 protein [Rhodocyclaceae bacterium]|nr:glycosyltransferase family 39 protein [Rhodocyclaceae bacterium]
MNLGARLARPLLPWGWLALLAALYLLAGTAAHDPWKAEDAIHLGIAYGFAQGDDWRFPHIANEPWPHTAPLYHWLAALLGLLLGDFLDFHNAARLATAVFGAIFLTGLAGAARAFFDAAAARLAPLLALGTLGLMLPLHEAQPAVAGLAGAALAWWGGALLWQNERPRRGALLFGLGIGLAFLAHGLAGLVMASGALLPLALRRDGLAWLLATLTALPLFLCWPLLVEPTAPGLWASWWANELAEATTARRWPAPRHLKELLVNAWPLWPLALWSLWLKRRDWRPLFAPAAGSVLALLWYLSGSPRPLSLLPLILPLALLAAAGAAQLKRGAANAFDWFALITFGCAAALVWLGASALALGWPAKVAHNFEKLAPGHLTQYSPLALGFALLVTLAWLATLRLPRSPWRAPFHWAAGLALMWSLAATLWFAWIDHHKSYRPVVAALKAALPPDFVCLERINVGPAQRAMLDYFAGLRTVPPGSRERCHWRLVIDTAQRASPAGWEEVWRGNRLTDRGEKDERWILYRARDEGNSPGNT